LPQWTAVCRPCKITYTDGMKTKRLTDALERVEHWPAERQEQLAAIALDIDAGLEDGVYHPTPEELEGIDRGLRDAEQGRFATDEEMEAAFATFRHA
jgi:predicted transcriptional regulator